MDAEAYTLMASHEANHWWFVGRRAVIDALLDRMDLPSDAAVLEAGCGTGGNLYLLQGRGHVSAFDPYGPAIDIARRRHPDVLLESGSLPDRLPFAEGRFHLVAALDVLEHVDDDRAALAALARQARPGGYVLVSVPTHPILWGSHDRRLHHKRRYGLSELRRLVDLPGVKVEYFGAYNTLLAPLAVVLRLAEKLPGVTIGNQERRPPGPLNRIFASIFALEGPIARRAEIPFGLSQAVILRRDP